MHTAEEAGSAHAESYLLPKAGVAGYLREHRAWAKGMYTTEAATELPAILKNAFEGRSIAIGIANVFTSSGEPQ